MLKDLIELIKFMYKNISESELNKMVQFYASNINEYKQLKEDCQLLSLAG
jgi:hypothetical protein